MSLIDVPPANDHKILAGIITYNPNTEALLALIASLDCQPCNVIVLDNASESQAQIQNISFRQNKVKFFSSKKNIGLAAAANKIFAAGLAEGYDFVALFDQDSLPEKNYLTVLESRYLEMSASSDICVAAIAGAHTCNYSGAKAPFVRYDKFLPKKICPNNLRGSETFDFLITSGCLFPLSVVKSAGFFDETLFIDNVDVEWCCRVKSRGYKLVATNETSFSHSIGDEVYRCFGRIIARQHSPIRSYYSVRNLLALNKRNYVSRVWKFNATIRAILKAIFIVTFSKNRLQYSREILRGIRDVKDIPLLPQYKK
ncbi:rhamnosyltransferase [Microbulbifer agarilyticus]|uniref:rhamnosyltransferase n=1 Tax=Microbulbifer agarilyticus TaxID=260552 RepID=UPI001CD247F8|nr:rhamnosyltransferase [Microbulbifer agarilyticus]MCA0893713.1 rhamnosyltransferase [Microbulbifer agarilyticus]